MSKIELVHTDSKHPQFQILSFELERELFIRDGELAEINNQLNKIDFLRDVILLFAENIAVACGAFREYDPASVEIKRMYVTPEYRQKGFASKILIELENLARKKGFNFSLLETGKNQPEAISFYLKNGYLQIQNFGQYAQRVNSVCFRKEL